jgi:hypothetical protein
LQGNLRGKRIAYFSDVIWAPIAATALRSIYGGSNVIFALEFLEEILPFTDIIPIPTMCWAIESFLCG